MQSTNRLQFFIILLRIYDIIIESLLCEFFYVLRNFGIEFTNSLFLLKEHENLLIFLHFAKQYRPPK